ncbi:MAG: dockerin type I domain-containing protein [Clostridiales bacterium]|nr:dockerin type I domain-containing protein [Clostridiales bacterium]
MSLVNGQWTLTYDSSKLSPVTVASGSVMPNVSAIVSSPSDGTIKGNFTSASSLYDFTTATEFVTVTFNVIGEGTANVDLDVIELSVGYETDSDLVYANAVADSAVQNITGISGFSDFTMSSYSEITTDSGTTFLKGDANGDEMITVVDATYIQKCVVGTTGYSITLEIGDMDNNNTITVADATYIQKMVVGSAG